MKNMIRIATMLTCVAVAGVPLAAGAQSDTSAAAQASPSPSAWTHHHGHHHRDPFFRALHTLSLTDQQKAQVKGFFKAMRQANENATPEQRKENQEKLHQQILGVLTRAQQEQLKDELAKTHTAHRHAKSMMPQAGPSPSS